MHRIGGTPLAAGALGSSAEEAFVADDTVWVIGEDGRIEPWDRHLEMAARGMQRAGGASPALSDA